LEGRRLEKSVRDIVFLSGGRPDKARRFLEQERLPLFEKPLTNRNELVHLV
jgi:hypothetical protein